MVKPDNGAIVATAVKKGAVWHKPRERKPHIEIAVILQEEQPLLPWFWMGRVHLWPGWCVL
jgi:hypothetical protein